MGEYLAWPWFWPAALTGGAAVVALAAIVLLAPVYKHILCLKYLFAGWKAVVPLVSALPAALGVFLLILVFSIMDGFAMETREMVRGTLADVIVGSSVVGLPYYDEFAERIERIDGIEAATPIIQTYAMVRVKSPSLDIAPIVRICSLIGIRPAEKARMGRFLEYLGHDEHPAFRNLSPERLERLLAEMPERIQEGAAPRPRQGEARPWTIAGSALVGIAAEREKEETVDLATAWRVSAWALAAAMTVATLFVWRSQRRRPGHRGWAAATIVCATFAAALYATAILMPARPGFAMRPVTEDMRVLAWGDDLVVSTIPIRVSGALEMEPGGVPKVSTRAFALVDTFQSNYWEADSSHVYVDFAVAQEMAGMKGDPANHEPARANQIHVKLRDPAQAGKIIERIREAWGELAAEHPGERIPLVNVNTWEMQQQMILSVVKMQRNITALMIGLMFVGFGVLIALISFVMVHIKSRDIGILKAVGASDSGVGSLFLGYGFLVGLLGTAVGMTAALLMLHHLDQIEIWVNRMLDVDVFPRTMYYFEHIPRHVSPEWCAMVGAAVLALATLASLAGGLLAAFKQPVETLRYE